MNCLFGYIVDVFGRKRKRKNRLPWRAAGRERKKDSGLKIQPPRLKLKSYISRIVDEFIIGLDFFLTNYTIISTRKDTLQINLLKLFFKIGTRSNEWFVGHWFSVSKLSCLKAHILIASVYYSGFPSWKKSTKVLRSPLKHNILE